VPSLDWPVFGAALWAVSDATGIRPEWQLPVLYLETAATFDPAIVNRSGCVGLNQFCPGTFENYVPVSVEEYRKWPASMQLSGPILKFWRDARKFGRSPRSATRLMLAQLGRALLSVPPSLDRVVFRKPSEGCGAPSKSAYCGNALFDVEKKGFITEADLARAMSQMAQKPQVKDAIAQAYAMRPEERMRETVFGEDYERVTPPTQRKQPSMLFVAGMVLTLVSVAGLVAYDTVEAARGHS
jgi:hypothetical protein